MTTTQLIPFGKKMFVFYDFETTGKSPAFDQPLQFAAILTDDDFRTVDQVNLRCRLVPHILPAPWALAVTGVTPDQLIDPDLPSLFEFSQQLSDLIHGWGPATWVGYNTIAFDEEILRQTFYQNLHPELFRTQKAGNDRMDLMKLIYAVWELANGVLEWPKNDKGQQSFRLDQLAPANGFGHENAHDALADVEATIHIARLIRERAPEVWSQALRNRSKEDVNQLLETGKPLRLVERFGAAPPRTYVGAFAGRDPINTNRVGFLDLNAADPQALSESGDVALARAVSGTPKLIRSVSVNKFPAFYTGPDATAEIEQRAQALADMDEFREKVGAALAARYADQPEPEDVEQQIYSTFVSDADRALLSPFQSATWEDRQRLIGELEDVRLRTLGARLIYENAPNLLGDEERERNERWIQQRWATDDAPWTTFADVESQLADIAQEEALAEDEIKDLRAFYESKRPAQ